MRSKLLYTLLILCLMGCDLINIVKGNGDVQSDKRSLDNFTEVHLTGNYEIGLKKGPKEQVVIVTDSNLLEFIDTEIDDGTLIIDNSRKVQSDYGIKVYITYTELNHIRSVGASVIKTDGPILADKFELEVPGAGLIDLEVEVKDLEVMLAGASSVSLRGSARNQSISMNGVGNFQAFELESQSCQVTVSGMGGAEIFVKENLNARVNGVGSIKYKGNPETVEDKVSGLGTISPADQDDYSEQSESI